MRERPILMSGPLVLATIAGLKTQTRRVIPIGWRGKRAGIEFVGGRGMEDDPECWGYADEYGDYHTLANEDPSLRIPCPYGQPGDRLWVRETWRPLGNAPLSECTRPEDVQFAAGADEAALAIFKWRPSIFMPRWASRLTLAVESIRVERVQDISEEDARAEGVTPAPFCKAGRPSGMEHVEAFEDLWQHINGKRPGCSWEANPWVFVIGYSIAEVRS